MERGLQFAQLTIQLTFPNSTRSSEGAGSELTTELRYTKFVIALVQAVPQVKILKRQRAPHFTVENHYRADFCESLPVFS